MERAVGWSVAWIAAACLWSHACAGIAAGPPAWSYTGPNGPAKWGKLGKDNATCGVGEMQSPIDIKDAKARKGDIPPLLFNYKPVPLRIVDTGYTIRLNYDPGSFVTLSGKRYQLTEIHFHKPGEEKIDGKGGDMGAHLVHKAEDGKTAIVAVMLNQGNENELVKALWSNLPATKGKEVVVDSVKVNARALLPAKKDYYAYEGSLTEPPCTEGITWMVLKNPVQLSGDALARFGRIYPMNARPVQPYNDRDVIGTAGR